MTYPTPTQIRYLDDEGILRIDFSDDRQVDYPTEWLRSHCPCAKCQGHGGPRRVIPVTDPRQAVVEDVVPVGNYAMNILWADGHNTGLYSWRWLHENLPPSP